LRRRRPTFILRVILKGMIHALDAIMTDCVALLRAWAIIDDVSPS